jgi:membrane protease YdiL (CAAX protease family)
MDASTTPMPVAGSVPRSEVQQLSLPSLLALVLIPGVLVTLVYVLLAPVVERAGFPPIAALLAAILGVMIPVELGVILVVARSRGESIGSLIPYRRPVTLKTAAWLVPTLVVAAFVGFGASMVVEPAVIDALFGWLPGWFVSPIEQDRIAEYSRMAWLVTLAAYIALNGLLGPIVEEIYFRGYLLPRMAWLGRWAVLANATLFSVYHFWSPWQVVGRILGFGPTIYAVRRTRNIYLGMVVHCTLNILGISLVANMVLSRI